MPARRASTPRERPRARAAAALVLSAAANAAALSLLVAGGALRIGPPPARVTLAPVAAERWAAHRRIEGGAPPAASHPAPLRTDPIPPAAPPRRAPPDPEGTLVRVAPAPDRRRPSRARFLAERDGTVERETRWRGAPARAAAALAARPTAGEPAAQGIPEPGEAGVDDASAAGRRGEPVARPDAAARIAEARRALAAAGADDPAPPAPAPGSRAVERGEGGARRSGAFDPRLLPVGAAFAALGGGAPSGDRLPGVADGDATLVNTRAFRFAGFYGRVREAIAGAWDPNRAWDARDPHDRLLGRTTRQVKVDILLDPDGRLREARLVRGSGLDFFDRECLRAIEAAAPFPNPPRALVGADGVVALRGWRLVFEWGRDDVLDRLLPGR